jgi:hypothetical protein
VRATNCWDVAAIAESTLAWWLVGGAPRRSDERDAEAATPVAEEIGEAGCAIVLIRPQLRVAMMFADTETNTRRQIEVCTSQFFEVRVEIGAPDPDPIFIVGLPRSGSTLLEQILASHSQIEGTQELSHIQHIIQGINGRRSDLNDRRYPRALAGLQPEDFRELGASYISGTRAYRRSKPADQYAGIQTRAARCQRRVEGDRS